MTGVIVLPESEVGWNGREQGWTTVPRDLSVLISQSQKTCPLNTGSKIFHTGLSSFTMSFLVLSSSLTKVKFEFQTKEPLNTSLPQTPTQVRGYPLLIIVDDPASQPTPVAIEPDTWTVGV